MSNKEIIKKVFDEKINKNEIYEKVLDKSFKTNKINFLYALAPICLIALIYFSMNDKLIINNVNVYGTRSISGNYEVKENKIDYNILKNIDIKENFKLESNYSNGIKNTVIYSNNKEYISISFSKENIIREFIKENDKISKINNSNINIYKYDDTFIALFEKENIYYNIETNTNKNDFLSLIKSIVK